MPPLDRKKPGTRRHGPAFDHLEARSMLNASPVTHYAFVPVHAEVARPPSRPAAQHARKPVHAEAKPQKATHAAALQHVAKASKGHLAHPFANASDVVSSPDASSPIPGTLSPPQVRTAYGVSSLPNQGQGVTVDIIDVYHVPTIANDLSVFSSQYGLPQADGLNGDPTFQVVTQPGTPNSPIGGGNDTALETTLDVEWVHAMAPYANIILQEVSSFAYNDGNGGGLLPGVHAAASTPGVVDVSVSYGSTEFNGQTSLNSFLAPVAGNPAAIAFSTGDDGYPSFPATSPQVLAVGGTGLYLASDRGRYGFETAWGGLAGQRAGGGGVSTQYGAPTFQSSNNVTFSGRAIPDLAAVGDYNTVVSVYDSYDTTVYGTPWIGVYGTSVATPIVSGIISLAQQDRIDAGLLPLTSPQITARIYAAYNSPSYATDFHDITVGKNSEVNSSGNTTYAGFSATTGYDLATGLGSPIGDQFVALLASP